MSNDLFYEIDSRYVEQGKADFWSGVHIHNCPYSEATQNVEFESWLKGWIDENRENGWFPSPNLQPQHFDYYSDKGE